MRKSLAYLGPTGTFCEEAAKKYLGEEVWELVSLPTIESVFKAVNEGNAYAGIVPIENSCEGAVNQTLNLLTGENSLQIAGEITLPVNHYLLAKPSENGPITKIMSHYQALAQCHDYLAANFPEAELVDISSTAEAARRVSISQEPWAAVATFGASEAYGLDILAANIQDKDNNETRFILLSQEESPYLPGAKTSLLVYVLDRPGALFEVLREFNLRNVNLSKIESRPARTKLGDYLFFIDIEGHQKNAQVSDTLNSLTKIAASVRVLGSYPVF